MKLGEMNHIHPDEVKLGNTVKYESYKSILLKLFVFVRARIDGKVNKIDRNPHSIDKSTIISLETPK